MGNPDIIFITPFGKTILRGKDYKTPFETDVKFREEFNRQMAKVAERLDNEAYIDLLNGRCRDKP